MSVKQLAKLPIDELLEVIARDCIESNQVTEQDFTAEQYEKYRGLAPSGEFWGGYAYLHDENIIGGEKSGSIRLYSPWGSGKWCFWLKGEKLVVDFS